MWEQSKSAKRRYHDGAFHTRYFVGHGVDIGGAPDPLVQYVRIFPLMQSVKVWDLQDGDAQYMEGVPDNTFDFVHSSHCLEHMQDVRIALQNWLRVTKPGGYLVITVPDEELYEHGYWPSRYNSDHKWSFTMCRPEPLLPKSINVVDLAKEFAAELSLERMVQINDFFRPELGDFDQTLTPVTECCIEIIWRKR